MQIDSVKSEKAFLRKKYSALRSSTDDDEKKRIDALIAEALFSLEEYKNAKTVFLYASKGGEADTFGIMERALADKKSVALPRCRDNCEMDFYYIGSANDLELGSFGVYEPKPTAKFADPDDGDLCVVPGLLFSKGGARLGYGKGFYDRFLPRFKGTSAGLCAFAFLTDSLPSEATDRAVDMVITENGVYRA